MAENCFYGIPGIQIIWHGEWADPELVWNGQSFDYYDLEMPLWEVYREECDEAGVPTDDDKFGEWIREHADLAEEYLRNLSESNQEASA